jgi:drug/metabolite transporter (DMT)-like permease
VKGEQSFLIYSLGLLAMIACSFTYGYLCSLERKMREVHFSVIMFYISGVTGAIYLVYTLFQLTLFPLTIDRSNYSLLLLTYPVLGCLILFICQCYLVTAF